MNVYLICNNMLSDSINYDNILNIEDKKTLRPLSIEGVKFSKKINNIKVDKIVSSTYISCIESAKYLSEKLNINIELNKKLYDCKIGEIEKQSIKMLSYFQEHDFDYKLVGGESINECSKRVENVIDASTSNDENVALFLPRKAILCYLTKICEVGYNLDEKLVLTFNDEIIMEPIEKDIEVIKLSLNESLVVEKMEIGE